MVKFCVFYHGKPEDPAAFDRYYWIHHLPLVIRWPGLKRIIVSKGQPEDDIYQIAELHFASRQDLEACLRSPERALAAEDLKNFPQFHGDIKRRIFEVTDYWHA